MPSDPASPTPTASRHRSIAMVSMVIIALLILITIDQLLDVIKIVRRDAGTTPWPVILFHTYVPWILWFPLAPLMAYAVVRFRISSGRHLRSITIHTAIALFVALANNAVSDHIYRMADGNLGEIDVYYFPPVEDLSGTEAPSTSTFFNPTAVTSDLLTYAIIVAILQGLLFVRDARDRERHAEQVESELIKTQLHSLRSRLQPHFLFNTLNGIHTLMPRDVDRAQGMLIRLSNMLRLSLREMQEDEVSLAREVEFTEHYLEIERVRFGPELVTEFNIDPGLNSALVPSLCLQPLVENAVRHGVGTRVGLGRIEVLARRNKGDLVLTVRDDGPGLPDGSPMPIQGIGLNTTESRLDRMYGDAASITYGEFANGRSGRGFAVTLRFPLRMKEQE